MSNNLPAYPFKVSELHEGLEYTYPMPSSDMWCAQKLVNVKLDEKRIDTNNWVKAKVFRACADIPHKSPSHRSDCAQRGISILFMEIGEVEAACTHMQGVASTQSSGGNFHITSFIMIISAKPHLIVILAIDLSGPHSEL